MNKRQAQRLLKVARALRESPAPEAFNMDKYIWCGTPACALGHYGSRPDLQRVMVVRKDGFGKPDLFYRHGIDLVDYWDYQILDHFGTSRAEAEDLFGSHGCGGAKTTIEAAQYIEDFVRRKYDRWRYFTDLKIGR